MVLLLPRHGLALTAAPGTGSTSLLELFAGWAGARAVPVSDLVVDGRVVVDAKHSPLRTVVDAGLVAASEVTGVRVITSTRNPYDFWAAEWHRTRTRWRDLLTSPDSWVHRQPGMYDRIDAAVGLDFDDWLEVALGDHARSGRTMHLNAGHVAEADVVVRMEHLGDDLAPLLVAVGEQGRVPHVNATPGRPPYREVYGPTARELVTAVHAPDLERFGYRF